jgi:hypothetical protein
VLDAAGLYAIPGLVDIHFHGCMGYDFCDATEEAIQAIADYEAGAGVLAICPATMTFNEEILNGIADAGSGAQKRARRRSGRHQHGGALHQPSKVGAQNPKYLQKPDAEMFRRLQARAGGLFKICDVAPEVPGAMEFIRSMKGQAVLSHRAHLHRLRDGRRRLRSGRHPHDAPVQRHAGHHAPRARADPRGGRKGRRGGAHLRQRAHPPGRGALHVPPVRAGQGDPDRGQHDGHRPAGRRL